MACRFIFSDVSSIFLRQVSPDTVVQEIVVHEKIEGSGGKSLRPPMSMLAGALFGLASAVLYTATNVALRHCVQIDAFLVSAAKAIPTVVILGPYLIWMLNRGEVVASSLRMVPRFVGAALVGQFIGNAFFQLALARIGLAISVPITLGTMIIGAAILGKVILNESVSFRTLIAMVILLASILVLSSPGNHLQVEDEAMTSSEVEPLSTAAEIGFGSVCAALSGLAYAVFGTTMRQALTGGLSAPLTMFISGSVGAISLWGVSLYRLGVQAITSLPFDDWKVMLIAGVFNLSAFVAVSISLKYLPVVAVNLLNASQVAMAAIAGIVFFAEPVTSSLLIGVSLTFVGLLAMFQRKQTRVEASD
jgi:DME family drug/metabolite transporter